MKGGEPPPCALRYQDVDGKWYTDWEYKDEYGKWQRWTAPEYEIMQAGDFLLAGLAPPASTFLPTSSTQRSRRPTGRVQNFSEVGGPILARPPN